MVPALFIIGLCFWRKKDLWCILVLRLYRSSNPLIQKYKGKSGNKSVLCKELTLEARRGEKHQKKRQKKDTSSTVLISQITEDASLLPWAVFSLRNCSASDANIIPLINWRRCYNTKLPWSRCRTSPGHSLMTASCWCKCHVGVRGEHLRDRYADLMALPPPHRVNPSTGAGRVKSSEITAAYFRRTSFQQVLTVCFYAPKKAQNQQKTSTQTMIPY